MKIEIKDKFISENKELIEKIALKASDIHDKDCNQKYDGNPYSLHLNMVASFAMKYCHFICDYEHHIIPIIFGAYFHDAIEDARMTYNDVLRLAKTFMTSYQAVIATEIVYALTDEKGRNRTERGSEKHYQDIRNTLYAPFIKWCDRYANYTYSLKKQDRMADVYKKEMPEFVEKLGCTKYVPKELIDKILNK